MKRAFLSYYACLLLLISGTWVTLITMKMRIQYTLLQSQTEHRELLQAIYYLQSLPPQKRSLLQEHHFGNVIINYSPTHITITTHKRTYTLYYNRHQQLIDFK